MTSQRVGHNLATEKKQQQIFDEQYCVSERVIGRKSRGPQVAGRNKLQVADITFPSLHKIKRGFF